MTAAEMKQKAVRHAFSEIHGRSEGVILGYEFTPEEFQTFIDQVCKEQLQKAADEYFDLCREYQDEVHNAILTAPKPDGL